MANIDMEYRKENALHYVKKLEEMFKIVKPVEDFNKLDNLVYGSTVLERIYNYLIYYGYTDDFSTIYKKQREIYLVEKNKSVIQKCAEKSIKTMGAKSKRAKKSIVKIIRRDYKKAIAVFLSGVIAISAGALIRKNIRDNQLEQAGEDIIQIFDEEFDYDNSVKVFQDNNEYINVPTNDFHLFLMEHDFTTAEIIYLTNKYDKVSLNKVLDYYGYSSLDNYLKDYYFIPHYSGSENPIVLYKEPSYKKLENAVEESIKNKAHMLEEYYGVQDSKGLGK